jgi:hypothetical protein
LNVKSPKDELPSGKGIEKVIIMKIQSFLKSPSPFLQRLLGRKTEPDTVDESALPEGILAVLADKPQQALAAALRCRPFKYGQIAILMGVSRDRVRQLEIRAADTLRRASRFRQLCRFIPGWQNALRVRPGDKLALLPGETIPSEYRRKRKLQNRQGMTDSKLNRSAPKPSLFKKKKSKNGSPLHFSKRILSSAKPR